MVAFRCVWCAIRARFKADAAGVRRAVVEYSEWGWSGANNGAIFDLSIDTDLRQA